MCYFARIFALLCGLATLLSVPAPAWPETLEEAWTYTLEADRRIAAAGMRRDAAYHELDGAKSARLPSLDVTGGFTQLDTAPSFSFGGTTISPRIFSNDNFAVASAHLSMPLFTSGMIRNGVAAAESAADASQAQLDTVVQDVKLRVAGHYVQVLRAESAVAVAESNVTTLSAHAKDARTKFEVGAVPQNDYLAASVSLANARQRLLQVETALDLARAAYNRILGRPLTTRVVLDPALEPAALPVQSQDLDALTELALEQRRELGAFAARADALREQSAAERASKRPQVMLTGGYTYLENEFLDTDNVWMVGLALQWKLFDSGRRSNRVASLDRQAMAVVNEREDLASFITLEVRQAWLDRREAQARQVVADATVEQAEQNLRVAGDRYRAGAGTSTEALDAETLRAQSLANRDNARYDAALAGLRLARAIGML